MTLKRMLYLLGFAALALVAPAGYQIDRLAASLPTYAGDIALPRLSAPATVESDAFAIPTVTAATRKDAFRILGYLHARDRLFQMDLMRRKSAGRLAELFGERAVAMDRQQRLYGFAKVAEAAVERLPQDQHAALLAYAEGVNAFIRTARERPPEFRVLRYQAEAWRPADSLLVALGMFQTLTGGERDERMLTLMDRLLPPEVAAFLTPDTDDDAQALVGGAGSLRPARPVPAAAIARLVEEHGGRQLGTAVDPEPPALGSNNWAVSGNKTTDGRAMIANDMHLPLGLPNIWYRARLRYGQTDLVGVTLPGLPLLVVGSNGRVAWGFTNVEADLVDLVRLDIDPADPGRYRGPAGWETIASATETIGVKDGQPVTVQIRNTVWGPVSPELLGGQPVAIRWTALDPAAINLGLLDMDTADTLEQGMAVLNRAGSPPQNVVLADNQGRIGWTLMGYFPLRRGFDGSVSVSWTDGGTGWDGFIPPDQLPRVVNPPEGFLATANNRTLGPGYPYVLGHDFSHSYRAHRIAERLRAAEKLSEPDLLALQLDTVSGFYEFYRQLALSVLDGRVIADEPTLAAAKRAIERWDGRLDRSSLGIGLLIRWRKDLAEAVFSPLVSRCTAADPGFSYAWREQETPLRALLREQIPDTLPDRIHPDWPSLLRDSLRHTAAAMQREYTPARLEDLTWGRLNPVRIAHPFSKVFEPASWLLDMPEVPGACNSFCLKVLNGSHGASERMVVSPAHPENGILHMPGGQSGHPFSPHYRDQEQAWAEGTPLPLLPGKAAFRQRFLPD